MNEEEWLSCTDWRLMLASLRDRVSDRKLRLFATACCRLRFPLPLSHGGRAAVEVGERFADGLATRAELDAACYLVETRRLRLRLRWSQVGIYALGLPDAYDAASNIQEFATVQTEQFTRHSAPNKDERAVQTGLVRDLFGNPFRSILIALSWLAWYDGTVRKMAQVIYDEHSFDRLPLLADALEEAGCDDREILDHCRSGGEHVRGCWVVDLLLGKS